MHPPEGADGSGASKGVEVDRRHGVELQDGTETAGRDVAAAPLAELQDPVDPVVDARGLGEVLGHEANAHAEVP